MDSAWPDGHRNGGDPRHPDEKITDVNDEELLQGGIANAGAVVRSGSHVLRPSNEHSASIHSFLTGIRSRGFAGASEPVSIDPDGRERLLFVPGDVPLPPYPSWAQTDEALASVAALIRGLHDASADLSLDGATWSSELADPDGGPVMCHNDVCLENVVFRDGSAVALLDFDFVAPGRRAFDLAAFARMCVPIDDDVNASRLGWTTIDKPERLRVACDAYGCDESTRADVLGCLSHAIERGGEFVRRRVEAGEVAFIEMWNNMGGQERFDRQRQWWSDDYQHFADALR
jgi:Phosphotransferase enzyme family